MLYSQLLVSVEKKMFSYCFYAIVKAKFYLCTPPIYLLLGCIDANCYFLGFCLFYFLFDRFFFLDAFVVVFLESRGEQAQMARRMVPHHTPQRAGDCASWNPRRGPEGQNVVFCRLSTLEWCFGYSCNSFKLDVVIF